MVAPIVMRKKVDGGERCNAARAGIDGRKTGVRGDGLARIIRARDERRQRLVDGLQAAVIVHEGSYGHRAPLPGGAGTMGPMGSKPA